MRADYMAHCREALDRYGDAVKGKLASVGHYRMWMASQKAETQDTRVTSGLEGRSVIGLCWVDLLRPKTNICSEISKPS